MAFSDMSQISEAIASHEKSLMIDKELGNVNGEATDLNNLGVAYQQIGDYTKAYSCFEQANTLFIRAGDRDGEGVALIGFELSILAEETMQARLKTLRSH